MLSLEVFDQHSETEQDRQFTAALVYKRKFPENKGNRSLNSIFNE